MKKTFFSAGIFVVLLLAACGGGGGGGGGSAATSSGTVALYVTDNLSDYKEVVTTISNVEILHTGTGTACDVLSAPAVVDIAELSSELLLLDLVSCTASEYNRIRVTTGKTATLTDSSGITGDCTFVSYKDEQDRPNALQCDADSCSLDITGMINVLVGQNTSLGLDFDLKNFEVENFGSPDCTVTMKVEPMNSNDIDDKKMKGSKKTINGVVLALNTGAQTFTLTGRHDVFAVAYSGVNQPGINDLLLLADTNDLQTKVKCSVLDEALQTCSASGISVKADGTVSDMTASTFVLALNGGIITVDISTAEVEGIISNGSHVEVELYGFNGTAYLAWEVEVEGPEGTGVSGGSGDGQHGSGGNK